MDKITSAGYAFGCALELAVGQRALPGSEEGTPADGEMDGDGQENKETDEQNFPALFHLIFTIDLF